MLDPVVPLLRTMAPVSPLTTAQRFVAGAPGFPCLPFWFQESGFSPDLHLVPPTTRRLPPFVL